MSDALTSKENPHAKALREITEQVRRSPVRLDSWIPVQQKAADELDRLTAEVLEQCRLNGLGSEREAALMGKVERLTARVAELEEALQQIASGMRGGQVMYASEYWAIARAALGERT